MAGSSAEVCGLMIRLRVVHKPMPRRDRFRREHVQHRAGQMAVVQQVAQRVLIDQRAAADVHHAGAARQQAQPPPVDQAARRLGERAGEHQELRPRQHPIEARQW